MDDDVLAGAGAGDGEEAAGVAEVEDVEDESDLLSEDDEDAEDVAGEAADDDLSPVPERESLR
ncbi:hypothetical protein [Actinoplanes sp. NPDC051859]|uniref:hypothetical protein n=1 Tax=Actinoplanes sp. NPDC051859 TaxID=3363909 RepID=UPI0037BB1974